MNEQFNFDGIFDLKSEDFKQQETNNFSNPDFYSPRLDDENVKDNIYQSKIRFVPNVNQTPGSGNANIAIKHVYYLPDPDNPGQKCYIDAPSNEPKAKDIASVAFMMFGYDKSKIFRHDTPVSVKKNAKQLKRNTYHYSLVQIIKDVQHPELEGSIKIMRYGGVVYEKVMNLINGNPSLGVNPVIPFDPFNGKDFLMVLSKGQNDQGQELNTYMSSRFVDEKSPIIIGGKSMANTPEDKMTIYNHLKEKSPDLSQVVFTGMSDEDIDKLNRAVRDVLDDDECFAMAYQQCYGKPFVPDAVRASVMQKVDEDFQEEVVQTTSRQPEPQKPATETVDTAVARFRSLKDTASPATAPATDSQPTQTAKSEEKPSISDMMSDLDSLDDLEM